MGIIVLAVAILPMLGVDGMQLYRAKIAGPVKNTKLKPRMKWVLVVAMLVEGLEIFTLLVLFMPSYWKR